MNASSVLEILIKVNGMTAAAAQLKGLEKELDKVGGSAGGASDSLGHARSEAAAMSGDLGKAQSATGGLSRELDKAAGSAENVAAAHGNVSRSTRSMASDVEDGRQKVSALSGDVEKAAKSTDLWADSNGRWRNSTGQFASAAEKARAGVSSLGSEFDTLHTKKSKADDLINENVGTFGGLSGAIASTTSAVSGLGGGFSPLVGALLLAAPITLALGAAAFALGAALAPLVGLGAAAAVGLTAFGQAAGVVALATMGVADAVKQQQQAQDNSGKTALSAANQQRSAAQSIAAAQDGVASAKEQVRSASQALAQAERGEQDATANLAKAQQQAEQAQKAVSAARMEAKRSLQGMTSGLEDARVAEREAAFGLEDANAALAALKTGASQQQLLTATQAVTGAVHNQQAAVLALADAQRAYQDLINPTDPHTLAEAQQAVTDAQTGQESSAVALTKAQDSYNVVIADGTSTALAKADALATLHGAQNSVADSANRTIDAQAALDKLNAGPTDQDKAKGLLAVQQAQDQVTDATNGVTDAQAALTKLQTPASQEDLAKALLAIRKAQDQVATSTRDRERQEKDLAAADAAGIAGTQQMIAARQQVAQADDQVTQAERALGDAHTQVANAQHQQTLAAGGVTKALQHVKDAQAAAAASAAGLTQANEQAHQKFNDLPPAAQAFVTALLALKPKLDELRQTAAAGLFPGVVAGLKSAMGAFEPVKRVVGETASVLGELAKKAGELIGSAGFGKDIATIGGRNALIIGRLGDAAIHVVSALRNVIVAAGPLATWLAKVADGWAAAGDAATGSARKSGALAAFFEKTKNVAKTVADVIGNIATAFYNVGRAAAPFGSGTLGSIDSITKKFAEWTASVGGQQKIQDFFRQATSLAGAFVKAAALVGKILGELAISVMPPLASALKVIAPYIKEIIIAFLLYKVTLTAVTVATNVAKAAMALWAGATKVAAAAQWLLNAALDANPIGLVVVAIAALAAGIVLAYQHSQTFRDIVNSVWTAIKSVAGPVIDWLSTAVPAAFHVLVDAASAVVSWLKDNWLAVLAGILTGPFGFAVVEIIKHWGDILAFFQALPGRVVDLIKALPGALVAAGSWMLDQIVTGFEQLTSLLAGLGKWALGTIEHLIHLEVEGWKIVGSWVLDRVSEGFKAVTALLSSVGSWIKGQIEHFIHIEETGLKIVGSWITDTVVNGLTTVTGALKSVGSWLFGQLERFVHAIANDLGNLGSWVVNTLINGFTAVTDKGVSAVTGVGDWLLKQLKKDIGTIAKDLGDLGSTIIGWIIGGLEKGAYDLQTFLNKIIDLVNKLPGVSIKHLAVLTKDDRGNVQGFARGGAFARTGGYVTQPMTFLGEEAPVHPEFIIPTNPAYRGRAHDLLAQAAGAIGFAQGGVYSQQQIADLWKQQHGDPSKAVTMSWIAEAESGGDAGVNYGGGHLSPLGQAGKLASGLYQILGLPFPGDVYDAATNTRMAIAKSSNGTNLHPWDASHGVWGPHVSSGGGIIGAIKHAIGGVVNAIDPAKLIGDLPGTDGLGWLKGLGSYAIDKAKDYITGAIGSLIPGVGGGGVSSGPDGVGTFRGFPMANWVIDTLKYAENKLHTVLQPTSGWRSQAQQDAIRAADPRAATVSEHLGKQYPHGAVDFGGFNDAHAKAIKDAVVAATADFKWPLLAPIGFVDDGHASGTGHYMGGVWGGGVLDSYQDGTPFVPQTGPYLLHKGEAVTPAGQNARQPAARNGEISDDVLLRALSKLLFGRVIDAAGPAELAKLGEGATAGIGYQGARRASTTRVRV